MNYIEWDKNDTDGLKAVQLLKALQEQRLQEVRCVRDYHWERYKCLDDEVRDLANVVQNCKELETQLSYRIGPNHFTCINARQADAYYRSYCDFLTRQ
jgi:hypothetical protein